MDRMTCKGTYIVASRIRHKAPRKDHVPALQNTAALDSDVRALRTPIANSQRNSLRDTCSSLLHVTRQHMNKSS